MEKHWYNNEHTVLVLLYAVLMAAAAVWPSFRCVLFGLMNLVLFSSMWLAVGVLGLPTRLFFFIFSGGATTDTLELEYIKIIANLQEMIFNLWKSTCH